MQVNRINVYAIGLLQKDQAPEADLALQKALKLDPTNPFTLNNLGYAREKEGELEDAYKYYTQAAGQHSDTPIVVTITRSWRGKGISQIAEGNAKKVQNLMEHEQSVFAAGRAAEHARRRGHQPQRLQAGAPVLRAGVQTRSQECIRAEQYGLSGGDGRRPRDCRLLLRQGREADQSSMKVAYASRKDVEGMKLSAVASDSDDAVNKATEEAAAPRREEGGPVVLRYRDNSVVIEPPVPPKPETTQPIHSVEVPEPGSGGLLQPLPESEQPVVPPARHRQPGRRRASPRHSLRRISRKAQWITAS